MLLPCAHVQAGYDFGAADPQKIASIRLKQFPNQHVPHFDTPSALLVLLLIQCSRQQFITTCMHTYTMHDGPRVDVWMQP